MPLLWTCLMSAAQQWPPPDPVARKRPPTVYELAEMASRAHWVLEQLAYDLPKGTATPEQRDAVVVALEGLAALLTQHNMSEGGGGHL